MVMEFETTVTWCEVDDKEMEEYDEVQVEEDTDSDDFEEYFEEGELENMMKLKQEIEDRKKVIAVQKIDEEDEEEFVEEPVMEEEKLANSKQEAESEGDVPPAPPDFQTLLRLVGKVEQLHSGLTKFLHQWNYHKGSIDSMNVPHDAYASFHHDALLSEQAKGKNEGSEQAKGKNEGSEQAKGKNERSEPPKEMDEGSEQAKGKDERSKQAKGKDERSEPPKGKDERSEQSKGKDERSEQAKGKDERSEQAKGKDERSRIEIICDDMECKSLRRYIESNLSDIDLLRREVPEALRRIPNPENLVFLAVGKFYKQGIKAYNHDTNLISCRRAGILLLEFLILSGRTTRDSSVKEKAMIEALLWWKRLVNENMDSATAEDSCGLILYLACFGIPKGIGSKDLCILLKKSNLKKNIDIFRRSNIIVARIRGVTKDLIKAEMYFEAAELSCYFGLTETFSPLLLLSSFVAKVIHTGNSERKRSQGSASLAKEANIRELKTLKSVVQFMEEHNLDAHDLSSVNIHKEISKLEEYIEEDAKRTSREKRVLKRKAPHSNADERPETQFNDPHPPRPSKTLRRTPSQPPFPASNSENLLLSAAVSGNSRQYSYDLGGRYSVRSAVYSSSPAGYGFSAMNYYGAPVFYQPTASSLYANGRGVSSRYPYQC